MKHLSLFSGIGGFDLAAEWMGWENVAQVEIDPFCQKVLEKNFPNTKRYGDIRTFPASDYAGRIDIITGGFPCQPFSSAGKRKGRDDNRHLWPEMLRVIREIKPTWVVAENVRGLLSIEDGMAFEQVCVDLENEGYEVQPIVIPAVAVNAPHRRDRVWFIANARRERSEEPEQPTVGSQQFCEDATNSDRTGHQGERIWFIGHSKHHGRNGAENAQSDIEGSDSDEEGQKEVCQPQRTDSLRSDVANTECERPIQCEPEERTRYKEGVFTRSDSHVANPECKRYQGEEHQKGQNARHSGRPQWDKHWFEVATEFCSVDDGLPVELGEFKRSKSGHRNEQIKAYGNAIVPQVAYEIFKSLIAPSLLHQDSTTNF